MPPLPCDLNQFRQKGFSLLLAVLVFGTVGSSIALYLLLTGSRAYHAADILKKSHQAQKLADACAELALNALSQCPTVLTATVDIDGNQCSYLIEPRDPGAIITAQATVDSLVRRVKVDVTNTSSSIQIGSWQEIGP